MVNRRFGYIINESAANVSEVEIVESGRRVVAKGVLQTGDSTNRNGRRYRTRDLVGQIHAPRQKELLRTGNMLGEAGHPMTQDLLRQQTIDPKYVCVRYLKFWNEGNDIWATFKGTNNELGAAFDLDLRDGVLPAFSYRALGTIEETAEGAVVNNLKMITYDYVIYPSHPTAYTSGLVTEGASLSLGGTSRMEKLIPADRINGTKSFIESFNNQQVLENMSRVSSYKESALQYIMDTSKQYNLLKECFDITKAANVDLGPNNSIIITESGIGTIVMDIDDYIMKEILTYSPR